MNEASQPMMRVRDWERIYENNRSRDMKRTNWFPAPNDLSSDRYVGLVHHEHGAAHLGVWVAVLMVASRAVPQRGLLAKDDGEPHNAESLALVTRLPGALVEEALQRMLRLRLLELAGPEGSPNDTPPHPDAGNPQGPAASPQQGAVEGKGREHHHQEEKRTEKKGTRTEPKGTERAREELTTEGLEASVNTAAASSQNGDDADENPRVEYASPEDELKAIYQTKTGEPITADLLRAIRVNLELSGVSLGVFVVEARKHTQNAWRNPPGFLRDLSKRFRTKTCRASAPLTVAEVIAKNYQCPECHSKTPGEGAVLVDGKSVPCTCASPEWIERQRARGIFNPEAIPWFAADIRRNLQGDLWLTSRQRPLD
jgi:hypothetical protein